MHNAAVTRLSPMTPELVTAYAPGQRQSIERFRLHLASAGYRAYLLSDDDCWRWMQQLSSIFVDRLRKHKNLNALFIDHGIDEEPKQ